MRRLLPALAVLAALAAPAQAAQEPPQRVLDSGPPLSRVPTRLVMAGVDARVVPVKPDAGALTPPADPSVLGWWGVRGTTVLLGHTVRGVGGALGRLADVPVGSHATLSGARYVVARVEVVPKPELARRAPALFRRRGRPRLLVVTCGGYDPATGEYADNVVAVLRPAP